MSVIYFTAAGNNLFSVNPIYSFLANWLRLNSHFKIKINTDNRGKYWLLYKSPVLKM